MEFASRRGGAGGRVSAGPVWLVVWLVVWPVVAVLGGAACRRSTRPGAAAAPPATAALTGQVVDESARPIEGARVLALGPASDARAAEAPATATDADGRFRFEALPRGSFALLVEAAGLVPARLARVEVPGAEPVVKLAGQGRALEGVVVSGAAPVAGARVRLGADDGALTRETTTGQDGRFVFHGLGAGTFTLRATHETSASRAVGAGATAGDAAALGPVRLELAAGFVVGGTVVDDGRRALAGVEVRAEALAGEAVAGEALAEVMMTARDGRFRSGPLAPGAVRLVARAPGFVARAAVNVTLGGGTPASPRLELVRAATLAGRVVDARGAVVAGAEVRCVATGGDDLAVISAPLPLAAEAAALTPGARGAAPMGMRLARSDARGAFRFVELAPGSFHLEIARAPAVPLRSGEWTLAAGEGRDVGTLVLRDGVVASGRVLDEAGRPFAGARVDVVPSVGVFAVTDGAGAFSLTLPPGRQLLVASAAGFGAARATVDVAATSPPPVALRLSRADARLEGRAHDSGGRPLARAMVRAYALEATRAPDAATPPAGPALATSSTDAGGHFTLSRVPVGSVVVAVDHVDYPVTYVLATSGMPLDVTVPIAGGIDGEVRERGTGAVVARARVEAVGPKGQRASIEPQPRAGGAFRLKRLAPGSWTLTATAKGYREATRQVDVPPSPILGDASVRGLRLELEPSR